MLVEELENFVRLEVAAKRAEVKNQAVRTEEQRVCDEITHCQENEHEESEEQEAVEYAKNAQVRRILRAHQREERRKWQEQKEKKSSMECEEGSEAWKRTRPRAARCGAQHGR